MSDRKRKAAICCLIAASLIAIDNKKKRLLAQRNEDHSKHFNSSKDADNKLDCDDEEDEGEEEENYNAHNGLGLAIKVEPGLAEEDSMSEYHTFKEEIRDPLDTSVDIDTTIPIKQENNYSYEDSSIGEINIKEEPDSSDDDFNDILSQDCAMDSGEECNESNELSFDDKDYEIDGILHPNDAKDDCQVFGDFVAEELRKLKSEENRKKLKRVVQRVILKISESET